MPASLNRPAAALRLASLLPRPAHDALDDDDRDHDGCDFEPGVHEIWDPGCADDDEEPEPEPEAGDFWVERDDVLDALRARRGM